MIRQLGPAEQQTLALRYERYGAELNACLRAVYGERADELAQRVREVVTAAYSARPADLRRLDEARLLRPDWLQGPSVIGYVAYADRFAGDLAGVARHIDYLEALGVTYLHLMPLLRPRDGENDGGYAVADYDAVRADLGTMDDLEALAAQLRERGISLVCDLVLNHVAREHRWAERARAGERRYRDYFYLYPDRTEPDRFERTLPEIFPDFAPGSFTWDDDARAWVWTTFNSYQWDVNWSNPDVFCEYLEIICNLANRGVEVIRLDAIAFIWKRLGTICQGEPEVHDLTQALRAALRIVAPAVAFKAEAIVGPEQLLPYLGLGEHWGRVSDTAYHNSLMVQLWSALASRDTRLFTEALRAFPPKPTATTWATYVRCHDDIGWAVSDRDAAAVGLSGPGHRSFLSDFYAGEFPGSFARGLVFQFNPETNDRRISGSCASLAGLQAALEAGDAAGVALAERRILLLYTAVLGFGGVPLIYMGDELGLLNDEHFADDPTHASDNRWAHRPRMDWGLADRARTDLGSPHGRIYAGLRHAITTRQRLALLHASVETEALDPPDPRILLLRRVHPTGRMLQLYNVSEAAVEIPLGPLRDVLGDTAQEELSGFAYDLTNWTMVVEPYQALWLVAPPERP